MSVTQCIKRAGTHLSEADVQQLKDTVAEFTAEGMRPSEAAIQAAEELRAEIAAEYEIYLRQVNANNGVVPRMDAVSFFPAWHGSGARDIEALTTERAGEGEDTHFYGYGIYLSSRKEIADLYRNQEMRKGKDGAVYKVEARPEQHELLDLDIPMSLQPHAMEMLGIDPNKIPVLPNKLNYNMTGMEVFSALSEGRTSVGVPYSRDAKEMQRNASLWLLSKGIRGTKYKAPESFVGKTEDTTNYVLFSDDDVSIEQQFVDIDFMLDNFDKEGRDLPVEDPTAGDPDAMGYWSKFKTKIVDRYHTVVQAQKDIIEAAKQEDADFILDESMDVEQSLVTFDGRVTAKIEEFEQQDLLGWMELVKESGVDNATAMQYLHARHAGEANAQLMAANRDNPDREGIEMLSGMSNEEAKAILDEHADNQKLQDLGAKIDAHHRTKLDEMVAGDVLSQEQANKWRETYKHYIPLARTDIGEADNGLTMRSRGFDVRGKESKGRHGSLKKVDYDNMLAHIAGGYTQSVQRIEKNKVQRTVYELAKNHESNHWVVDQLPIQNIQNMDGTFTARENPQANNVLALKVKGEVKYITFNKNSETAMQMVKSLRNDNAANIGKLVKGMMKVNRFLSAINTSFSPEFVVTNLFRDVQAAAYNLTDTEIKSMGRQVMTGIPQAMAGIRRAIRTGNYDTEMAQIYQRFEKAGGKTGWSAMYETVEHRMEEIQKLHGGKRLGSKTVKKIENLILDYGTITENAARVSAFKAAVDAGLSDAKAAKIAKQLTVDFNRRGEMGIMMNALYLFWNAGIQGSARLLRAVANPKNHKLQGMLLGTVAAATMLEMMNRAAGEDEETGRNRYDEAKERYGERNLIIMDIFGDKGDKDGILFKIPLPWGYNVFHIMGQEIGAAVDNFRGVHPSYEAMSSASRLASGIHGAFNPMSDGSLLQMLSPTLADPLVRVSENKDWHGGSLYPNYDPNAENASKHFATARGVSVDIAHWLAETFRDDATQEVPQYVDVSPEWIDMAYDFTTGSLGRFVADSGETIGKLISGDDVELKRIPFARKFAATTDAQAAMSNFYDSYYEIKRIRTRVRQADGDKKRDILNSVGPRRHLLKVQKHTAKLLRANKKALKKAEAAGDEARVEELKTKRDHIRLRFLKQYNNTLYGAR